MTDADRTGPLLVKNAKTLGALIDEWQKLYDAGKFGEASAKWDEYWKLLHKQRAEREKRYERQRNCTCAE